MNRPMARNGFFDPEPWTSPVRGADGAFWLEFTGSYPISSRSSASGRVTPAGPAGQTGLEPATCGFGDRCATNCATALHGDEPRAVVSPGPGTCPEKPARFCPATSIQADGDSCESTRITSHSGASGVPARPRSQGTSILAARGELCHDSRVTTDDARTPASRSRISQRIGAIEPSATLAVDATAKALKAAGRPVIGFGAGEPDFPTPAHIVDAAVEAARDPRNHRYSATAGLPELREALAASVSATTALEIDPAQVLVTNGGKQAVFQAFATVLDPGDEVLLPAPYWTTSPEAIRQSGAAEVPVLAGADQGYVPTVAQLEAARTDRTRALVLCSPSNPTGAVLSPEQVEEIGRWALEHGLWV